ncbi:MAG: 23S rRNA (adenine(2503)-C(2))-methyltransferase RlmN [Gammaproteobacteria bacterium]|nr:23S rRNA (adenine(2503)-C(2))-methyltransferase RlmN [Gammaproteobacteria bacterium]MCW8909754.1 23S rRNA (adenine(2503)-C(2))-methyltransferase RlmN [Gammaproteobacteria bacterium]MCW9003772.1 23S rRNA (adenine(2503)-C(2))-methyltransferase RlmN [Gammaproteobacteria bacterium]MCW9057129.1 23S rRNA (adenine(2503)-C(2))-methyltransferase RlmN [Gammaproteobacteria bacterium]
MEKVNLLGMNRQDLEAFFVSIDEKAFRASQMMKWIHQTGVDDFAEMTNISKSLQQQLSQIAEIKALEVVVDQLSADGTRKWVFRLKDGNCIETVFIPEDDRGTLCISSQVGCALDCSFCSTARQGFSRNLGSDEILSQVWLASRLLHEENRPGRKISNLVLMGMGEPLLNYENVVKAIDVFLDDFAYGLSKRRVTVSTAGVLPAMDRLSDRHDVQLAISLHATDDELRNELVPVNRKYPIKELIAACHRFMAKRSPRSRLTIEYVMLAGVNDSEQHARELVRLMKGLSVLINLIPFNPFTDSGYKTSSSNAVNRFRDILQKASITTVIRKTRGEDIDAACGQLVGKVEDKSRRQKRFIKPRFGMHS